MGVWATIKQRITNRTARAKAGFYTVRQNAVNRLLTMLYGKEIQVLPKGYVGLAGAVVMWYIAEGQRFFLMIRNEKGDDKARFLSSFGSHGGATMGADLAKLMRLQCGEVFSKSVASKSMLGMEKVAAAPLFINTDDVLGVPVPVQGLVWLVQVHPHVVDTVISPAGLHVVRVPDNLMAGDKISPTHQALFASVKNKLPTFKPTPRTTERVEETVRDLSSLTRVVH